MTRRRLDVLLYGAAAVLGALLGLLSHDALGRSLRVPLYYKGDALFYGAAFKGTVVNGWYEYNPFLNAPIGQTQHDFPQADNAQYVFAKAIDLFTDDWVVAFNLTYLLTFPLAAMAAVWFLRLVGCSRSTALALSLLFAVAPYHYFHGISHLALSQYYVLPLGVGLVFLAYHDRAVWSRRRGHAWYHPLAWVTWRNAGVLTVLVLLGSTSSYYAVFTLMLFATTVVVLLLRRRISVALGAVATMAVLMAVMLLNMLPDLWYTRHTSNLAGFERLPLESEMYAVKLSTLVLPTHWNRIGDLGQWRLEHDATFPLPSEPTALGVVASVGFLVLLLLPVARLALHGRTSTASPPPSPTSAAVTRAPWWPTPARRWHRSPSSTSSPSCSPRSAAWPRSSPCWSPPPSAPGPGSQSSSPCSRWPPSASSSMRGSAAGWPLAPTGWRPDSGPR